MYNELSKIWLTLTDEEKNIIFDMKDFIYESETIENSLSINQNMNLFIKQSKEKPDYFTLTNNAYRFLMDTKVYKLDINRMKTRLLNNPSTKDDLLTQMSIFEDYLKYLKNNVNRIVEESENCQHEFKPINGDYRLSIFGTDVLYNWNSRCIHCKKDKTIRTQNDEPIPEGFENIKPKRLSF